jgi:hypothetical protein
VREIGRGTSAFAAPPVQGAFVSVTTGLPAHPVGGSAPPGLVALVDDHAVVELPALDGELAAVLCTSGDADAPLAAVAEELGIPCVLGVSFDGGPPSDGALVLVDCSGEEGTVAVVDGGSGEL